MRSAHARRGSGFRLVLASALLVALVLVPAPLLAQATAFDQAAVERRLAEAEGRKDWAGALDAAQAQNEHAEEAHLEALYKVARAGLFPARVHDFLTEQFFVEYQAR